MEAQAKSIEEKAKKLADQLNEHHDAAKGVAEVILFLLHTTLWYAMYHF